MSSCQPGMFVALHLLPFQAFASSGPVWVQDERSWEALELPEMIQRHCSVVWSYMPGPVRFTGAAHPGGKAHNCEPGSKSNPRGAE